MLFRQLFYDLLMMWKQISKILFPASCFSCQEILGENIFLCKDCRENLPYKSNPVCACCGKSLNLPLYLPSQTCLNCQENYPQFTQAFSPFHYEGMIKEMIHQFKYHHKIYLRDTLAEFLIPILELQIKADFSSHLLIPVPLYSSCERERKFNQAEEFCLVLRQKTKIPISYCLKKKRKTEKQAMLPRKKRVHNLKKAFSLSAKTEKFSQLKGKKAILIDDIFTSGATANECAKALKPIGFEEIFILTVARA